jgi:hypothetical protein
MPTIAEIRAKYKKLHDDLSIPFYEKKHSVGVTPQEQADFDTQHAKIWADYDAEIKTASDYVEPIPPRDPEVEIDELKIRLENLEKKWATIR